MNTTNGNNTPGGTLDIHLDNPLSSETGPMDSGEGLPLLFNSSGAGNIGKTKYLENENRALWERIFKMEEITTNLTKEIEVLKQENHKLKNEKVEVSDEAKETDGTSPLAFNYYTDEDELERETDWILQNRRPSKKSKKRKAESSPEVDLPTTSKSNEVKQVRQKEKPPPPVNIVGISNHSEIQELMKAVTDKEYKVTVLNNDVWKVNTTDSESYRNLTMKLNVDRYQWFTYEDKNTRPLKVMARGLHPTCSSKDIIEDLSSKGLKILNAVNIIKKERIENEEGVKSVKKRGLPLFMLTFDNKEKMQNIYEIHAILNMKVKIEPVRKTTMKIPQCKKCQGYNHTQKFCGREPRCVKCAGNHMTQVCTISKNIPAKCVNCKGQHPANYRGCEISKHLQKLRDQARKQKQNRGNRDNNTQIPKGSKQNLQENTLGVRESYSQVVKGSGAAKSTESDHRMLENIMNSIETLSKRLDEQNNLNKIIVERIKKLESAKAIKKQK